MDSGVGFAGPAPNNLRKGVDSGVGFAGPAPNN